MTDNNKDYSNILLVEANHSTLGITTVNIPSALVMIARYLEKTVKKRFDFKIFKTITDPLNLLNRGWEPHIFGISQYAWCTQAGLFVAKKVKERYPGCIIIAGGPNISRTSNGRLKYLQENPWVDFGVELEGEIAFTSIVKRLIDGESLLSLKVAPPLGVFSLGSTNGELSYASIHPPYLSSLDIVGPIYANGFADEMLDAGFHPFVLIERGCPFLCAFCHAGYKYYSKIRFQTPEIFKQEMKYLAKRFTGKHQIPLYLGSTNFGLWKEDLVFADIIREMQDTYDWPKMIMVSTVKIPEKIKEINGILKYKVNELIALQSVSPEVLKNINRKNIPFEEFEEFQRYTLKENGIAQTELILCLPGESKESFSEGLTKVLDCGVRDVIIWTLMKLEGTPIASDEFENRYSYVKRYRLVPRNFSEIEGEKIFETEIAIIGTNTMSEEDYYALRGYAFTISSFTSSIEFLELKRFLFENGIKISDWISNIHYNLKKRKRIFDCYENFMQETKGELFSSYDELVKHFENQENYDKLLKGEAGDNLIRKYKFQILFNHYEDVVELAVNEAKNLAMDKLGDEKNSVLLDDIQTYLLSRNLKKIMQYEDNGLQKNEFVFTYNIPHWAENPKDKTSLISTEGSHFYKTVLSDYSKKMIGNYRKEHKDLELALQIACRDGVSRDLWPQWICQS